MARYREFERPALVDVGARSTPSGGSQAAAALAQSLASFSRTGMAVMGPIIQGNLAKAGAEAGAAAGQEDNPEFKSRITAYGRAYNDAALRSYAIRSERDMEENAARLEAEAGTDPEAFREAMAELQQAEVAEAPAEARGILADIYNQRIGKGLARIQTRLANELREEDRALVQEQLDQTLEKIAHLRSQDTEEAHAESVEEEAKLFMLIDATVEDGTLSEAEGRAARLQAERGIVFETVISRFKNELDDPYGDPIGFIEDLKEVNRTAETLPPDQEAKLENALLAELRERNALRAARSSQEAAAIEARYAAGDAAATAMLIDETLTQRDLLQMTVDEQLKPAVARTLLNALETVGDRPARSDPERLTTVELNLLSIPEKEILTDPLLAWDDRKALVLKRREEAAGWKSTQAAKEAFARIDRALGIQPGEPIQMMSDDEKRKRDRALTQLYDVVDALPPDERQAAVLNASKEVVRTVIRNTKENELEDERNRLDIARRKLAEQDYDSEAGRKRLEREVETRQNNIKQLEASLAGGG